MRVIRLLLISLIVSLAALSAAQQDGQAFRLVFANTNLSSVLRAIGIRTGANIVYVGKEDPTVTLDVTAGNADEALRFVTTAASMTFRRVGQTYIVAKAEDMRQALEPFGLRYRMTLTNTSSADAASLLRSALPYLTVQPVGTSQLLLTGTNEDLEQAKSIIAQQETAAATQRATTVIVPIRLISATKVVDVLNDMYPDMRFRGVPQGDVGGSVIMTGVQGRVDEARQTLNQLDTTTPLPGAEETFKTYDIRYSSAPILTDFLRQAMPDVQAIMGPDAYNPQTPIFNPLSSSAGTGSSGSSGGSSVATLNTTVLPTQSNIATPTSVLTGRGTNWTNQRDPGETAKQIILHGPASRVDLAMQMLASVDLKPKQVTVEVKVVDYTPTSSSNVGFNWSWTPFSFGEVRPGTSLPVGNVTKPGGFGIFSRVPWSFASTLNALVTHNEAKILATPSVQVVDNEQATVFIGDTLRVQLSQATGLGTVTQTVQEFPIGIILLLRPRVNADGDVTLHVHPVVSTITSIDANNLPQTSTREAETTLIIKNGETIVLGGLIRDEATKSISEVPILSKLPLIGELFRNTTTTGRKSEIFVFITPKITDGTPVPSTNVPPPGANK